MSGTRGLRDWIIQRVTAVYLAVYAIGLFVYVLLHKSMSYHQWTALFSMLWFQIASVLCLIALAWHAWIGIWTVITDYIKPPCIRSTVQLLVILALCVYVLWGVEIIWHVNL